MNFVDDLDSIIREVSSVLGKPISKDKYVIFDRGTPHKPRALPNGMMGIYTFMYEGQFLKIGKAGPNSGSRFLTQHYNPKSAKSTLAASLLEDEKMRDIGITKSNVGEWIKNNCRRIDILIDAELGIFALELIEVILHYKYEPVYEGFLSQR